MRYREHLMLRASIHWEAGNPLPTDLFAEMLSEGMDVEALEAKHKQEPQ